MNCPAFADNDQDKHSVKRRPAACRLQRLTANRAWTSGRKQHETQWWTGDFPGSESRVHVGSRHRSGTDRNGASWRDMAVFVGTMHDELR